jgi:DNA-binding MarR family transcriptional regulator
MTVQPAVPFNTDADPADEAQLIKIARQILRSRRKRDVMLAPVVFADPEWDILLDLYVEGGCGRPVSMSSLCVAAAVPTTTAARAVNMMVAQNVLTKSRDPEDARRMVVGLAPATRAKMRNWLLQLAQSQAGG